MFLLEPELQKYGSTHRINFKLCAKVYLHSEPTLINL